MERSKQGLIRALAAAATLGAALALQAGCGTAADSGAGGARDATGFAGASGSPVPIGAAADPFAASPSTQAPAATASASPSTANPAGAGAAGAAAPATSAGALPCDVSTQLGNHCQQCHGATPIGGAPMSLLTYADFQRPAKTRPELKVYQLAQMRVHDAMKPMPPGGGLPAADFGTLDAWLGAGAPPAGAADPSCTAAPTPGGGGTGGDVAAGDMAPLVPLPGETCYELLTHQSTTTVDSTKYMVDAGEHYEQFYFDIPWPAGSEGTRFGAKFDNLAVLHHWLLFTSSTGQPNGFHETVIGTQLGDIGSSLIAGWAVGGHNVTMPDDVGFDLPDPGQGVNLNLQWHFFNSTGSAQPDGTAVQVCTVPAGTRSKLGSITWLGTENFNGPIGMPPGEVSKFGGTCDPSRTGMNVTDPIHIFFFWPHMHLLGVNMTSVVTHNGVDTEVFDKAFDFNHQIHYDADVDLQPGDTITSTCTFNNNTSAGVPFGPSTSQEMCYQFAFAYPAHALDNGVLSLIGATNTCW